MASVQDEIDSLIDEIDNVDLTHPKARDRLDEIRDRLQDLKNEVEVEIQDARKAGYDDGYDDGREAGYDAGYDGGRESGYDAGYDDGREAGYDEGSASYEKEEEEEALEELESRYQFALRMLELGYGVSERDLDAVSSLEPHSAFQKLTGKIKKKEKVTRGSTGGHDRCAYVGTCVVYSSGLADAPCGAGQTAHKGRRVGAQSPRTVAPALHEACSKGNCLPAQLGWIPTAERCS